MLAYGEEHNRVLLTHDAHTMPGELAVFLSQGRHSPGVLLIPQQYATGSTIDEVLLIWGASSPDEWRDMVTYLPL